MRNLLILFVCLGGLIGNGCASPRFINCRPVDGLFDQSGQPVQEGCEKL